MGGTASKKTLKDKKAAQPEARAPRAEGRRTPAGLHHEILSLQRLVGNRAVGELLRPSAENPPQAGPLPAPVRAALDGGGQPLDPSVRAQMESRFGHDFGHVRVHTDAAAAESAQELEAKAYTVGRDVVFGEGHYSPQSEEGRRLLAHELAHVIQQQRGGAPPEMDKGAAHERQAGHAADSVAQGQAPVAVQGATGVGVAREEDDEKKKKRGKSKKSAEKDTKKRGKEILEEFFERAHDEQSEELAEERLRGRSGGSEKQRHRTTSLDVQGHHAYPKFIGGRKVQKLMPLTNELHYLYHEELYLLLEKEFLRRGKLPADAAGKRASRKHYGRIFSRLKPAEQKEILDKVVEHAESFDERSFGGNQKYRDLYPDKRRRLGASVRRGIKEAQAAKAAGGPKGKAPGAKPPAGKTPAPAKPKPAAGKPAPKPQPQQKAAGAPDPAPAKVEDASKNVEDASKNVEDASKKVDPPADPAAPKPQEAQGVKETPAKKAPGKAGGTGGKVEAGRTEGVRPPFLPELRNPMEGVEGRVSGLEGGAQMINAAQHAFLEQMVGVKASNELEGNREFIEMMRAKGYWVAVWAIVEGPAVKEVLGPITGVYEPGQHRSFTALVVHEGKTKEQALMQPQVAVPLSSMNRTQGLELFRLYPPTKVLAQQQETAAGLGAEGVQKKADKLKESIAIGQKRLDNYLTKEKERPFWDPPPFSLDPHMLDEPRAHESSAQIAIQQGRLDDALKSIEAARALLTPVFAQLNAYARNQKYDPD